MIGMLWISCLVPSICCAPSRLQSEVPSKLRILHTNDIHAHLDEFNHGGMECKQNEKEANECFGGIARIKTAIDYQRESSDTIFLDAGDQFQGTLFFTFYKSDPLAKLMNALQYDAMCVGNHEFDIGQAELSSFIESLDFPVVSSNMDISHSRLKDSKILPYTIIEKYNLGIIGVITNTTASITWDTADIKFYDPAPIVQIYIDELHALGIKRIIALSHNGYYDDKLLAQNTNGLQLIVGGHSHSLLLNNPSFPGVVGLYPTVLNNLGGKRTYIVQAHRFGDYLGVVDLEWNQEDELISLHGSPIHLDQSIPQNPEIHESIQRMKDAFRYLGVETLAQASTEFPMCSKQELECAIAELVSECILDSFNGTANVAYINRGGVRGSFGYGNITVADVMTVLPFDDPIVHYSLTGKELFDIVEGVAQRRNLKTGNKISSLPQWAGLRYIAKLSETPRVQQLLIQGEPVEFERTYIMATRKFLGDGGCDITESMQDRYVLGQALVPVMSDYLRRRRVISPHDANLLDGRATEFQ